MVEPESEQEILSSIEDKIQEQEIQDDNLDLRGSDVASEEGKPKPAYKQKLI